MMIDEIPDEIAKALTNVDYRKEAEDMISRLSKTESENISRVRTKCPLCDTRNVIIEGKIESCIKCGNKLTQLAISRDQNNPKRSQTIVTDPKTRQQKKFFEIPIIVNKSAILPYIPEQIKHLFTKRNPIPRNVIKQRPQRESAPAETRTKILSDLQGACETWNKIFTVYIDSAKSEFRTSYLSEDFIITEFKDGKYKIILQAIKDLMDTLIELGEVPEQFFVNYKGYYQKAMETDDEVGIVYANRVVSYAAYYVQSPRSSVVTKRIMNAIK